MKMELFEELINEPKIKYIDKSKNTSNNLITRLK